MATDTDTSPNTPRPKKQSIRPRKYKRLILWLLVAGIFVLALLPKMVAPVARPIAQNAINDRIKGHVSLTGLGLSWFGTQRVHITLDDPAGNRVAEVTSRTDKGLLSLLLGSRKLGLTHLTGSVLVNRDSQGTTNLARALEPRMAGAGAGQGTGGTSTAQSSAAHAPAKLPKSLAGSIIIDSLELTIEDSTLSRATENAIGAIKAGALTGTLDFAVGAPASLVLKGPILTAADAQAIDPAQPDAGSLDITLTIDNLTDATGLLTVDAMQAKVAISLKAPAVDIALDASFAQNTLTRTGPTQLIFDTEKAADLIPALARALAGQPGVTISALPTITVNMESFTLPMGSDLRGAVLGMTINTTKIAGTIALADAITPTTTPADFLIEPFTLSLDAPDLAGVVLLTGSTRAQINSASAGTLDINMQAGDILDAQGTLGSTLPGSLNGQMRVEGFSTPILQPFVAAIAAVLPQGMALDLPTDLGPTLDITLSATMRDDATTSTSQHAGYDIDLSLKAQQATIDAAITVDGPHIRTQKSGVQLAFVSLAPMLDRLLVSHDIRVSHGAQVSLSVQDFSIDLSKLAASSGRDLRGLQGQLLVSIGNTSGTLRPPGHDAIQDYELENFSFSASTDDLSQSLTIISDASFLANNKPLASLHSNMVLSDFLDTAGSPKTASLPTLSGQIKLSNVATDTIDTLLGDRLADSGIVLVRDVGSPAQLTLIIEPAGAGAGAGAAAPKKPNESGLISMLAAPVNINLTFRARNLDITAPLTLSSDRLWSRDTITIVDRAAGQTLSTHMANRTPAVEQNNRAPADSAPEKNNNLEPEPRMRVSIAPVGTARLTIANLELPLITGASVPLDAITASSSLTLEGMRVLIEPNGPRANQPAQTVEIASLVALLDTKPGQAPRVRADGRFIQADQPFSLAFDSTLHGLFAKAARSSSDDSSAGASSSLGLDFAWLRPETTLTITDIPSTLARLLPASAGRIGEKQLNTALLWRDTLGKAATVTLTTSPSLENPLTTNYTLLITSRGLGLSTLGTVSRESFFLNRIDVNLGITPRVASQLASVFAADAAAMPSLRSPASISFHTTKHLNIPLGTGFAPDLAHAQGGLDAVLVFNAALAAMDLPASADTAPQSKPITIPPIAVKDLTLTLTAPASILSQKGNKATVSFAGMLLTEDNAQLVALKGSATSTIAHGAPVGPLPVTLSLEKVNTPWLDTLLAQPMLISGSLGNQLDLDITADLTRLADRAVGKPAPFSIAIHGPRFSTSVPIALAFSNQGVYLNEAITADWTIDPAWGNRYIFTSTQSSQSTQSPRSQNNTNTPALSLRGSTQTSLHIQRLAFSLGKGGGKSGSKGVGLFKPGAFILESTATLPKLSATLGDGSSVVLENVTLRIGRGPKPDQLGFALSVPRITIDQSAPITPSKSTISGLVAAYSDAQGNLTLANARLSATGGIGPIPTDIIDALAKQNGLLRDALGPTVNVTVDAKGFSKQGGTLHTTATTPLASLDITGKVKDGLFLIDPVSTVIVREITPELSARFQKAVPVIATLEKTASDEPARVIFDTPLALPIDDNLDRLNGNITIDIGTARFGTSNIFSQVLAIAQQKSAGQVGKRMPPLTIKITDGLVTYEPYPLPFGEFTLTSQGSINLSSQSRKIDLDNVIEQLGPHQLKIITFIPAGAFATEAVPALANIPLPLVGNLARLPIVTRGPINKPKSDIDADLMGKDALNQLTNPEKLLEGPAGDLLEGLFGKKKKKKK